MKKITLILSLMLCVIFINAQSNLVLNPSFENFDADKFDNWSVVGTPTGYVLSADEDIKSEGAKSLKLDAKSASATVSISQTIVVTPGEKYTLSLSYYVVSGDNTDARIWCNFKNEKGFFF